MTVTFAMAEKPIPILSDSDILEARLASRTMAQEIGFAGTDLVVIATAVSEVARNIVQYAGHGEVVLAPTHKNGIRGLMVIAKDDGPGIADVACAMQPGYSTSRGLGLGLPGVRCLMDEFEIVTRIGQGTAVTMRKWLR